MKYSIALLAICLVAIVFLLVRTTNLHSALQAANQQNDRTLADLQASLKPAEADLAKLKDTLPGLGEYMTTFQLHLGKLWFAA